MSFRDWRDIATLGLIGVLLVFVLEGSRDILAGGDFFRCQKYDQTPGYRTQDPEPPFNFFRVGGRSDLKSEAVFKKLNCNKPNDDKEYEHCQQWRSAQATEEQACVARWQLLLSVPAFFILAATFFYTAVAANAARESAESAEKALVVSRRPWLTAEPHLDDVGIVETTQRDGYRLPLSVELINSGQSPAVDVEVFTLFCPIGSEATQLLTDLRRRVRVTGRDGLTPRRFKPVSPKYHEHVTVFVEIKKSAIRDTLHRIENRRIDPTIVGCVLYNSVFAEAQHDVAFMVELRNTAPLAPMRISTFEVDDSGAFINEYPVNSLVLTSVHFAGPMS